MTGNLPEQSCRRTGQAWDHRYHHIFKQCSVKPEDRFWWTQSPGRTTRCLCTARWCTLQQHTFAQVPHRPAHSAKAPLATWTLPPGSIHSVFNHQNCTAQMQTSPGGGGIATASLVCWSPQAQVKVTWGKNGSGRNRPLSISGSLLWDHFQFPGLGNMLWRHALSSYFVFKCWTLS